MQAADAAALEQPTRLSRIAYRAGRLLGRIDVLTARIEPWMVLGPLVVVGWLVVGFVAHAAVHTGWLYSSGNGRESFTTAWLLAHGHAPYTHLGYGYALLLAPIARITGGDMLSALPAIVVFNVVVLAPIALLCVYAIAKPIAGRRWAYIVSVLWVLAPVLAIRYFLADYHRRYVGETLPAVLGLTASPDFPAMVAVLVAAFFCARALLGGDRRDALISGLAAGIAIGVKPASAAFLPALFVALLVGRRFGSIAAAALGVLPSLVCLLIWRDLTLGRVGLTLGFPVHWPTLWHNIDGLREYTWSRRMIEWAIVGGAIGIWRRSFPLAMLIGGWLASFLVLKGTSYADIGNGNFFRDLAPAFPAAFLLATAWIVLIPVLGAHLVRQPGISSWPRPGRARRVVLWLGVALAVLPVIPLLAFSRSESATAAPDDRSTLVPAGGFALHAQGATGDVVLSWPGQSHGGARVRYAIFRWPSSEDGTGEVILPTKATAIVSGTTATDRPGAGSWTYRVAAIAGAPPPADVDGALVVSRPVTLTVG
jgi:hypothetical protein